MRKLSVLVLIVFVLNLGSITFAQSLLTIQCDNLSTADCTLLTNSEKAMQTLNSATFDLNLQLVSQNIPDTSDLSIGLTGNGSYITDLAMINDIIMQEIDDPQVIGSAIASVIKDFNGDINFNLILPADIMSSLGTSIGTDPINIQIRLVDGIGYMNFEPLDSLFGGQLSQSGMNGWMGFDLAGAIELMYPMIQSSIPDMSSIIGNSPTGSTGTTSDPSMMISKLMEKFLTVTRQPDVDGSAVFVTNLDVSGLMNDPDVQKESFKFASAQDPTITEDQYMTDLDKFAASFTTYTINMTQVIDLNSNFIRSQELAVVANMDVSGFSDITASESDPLQLSFVALIALDSFNDAPLVTTPENAIIVPLSALFGS